MGMAAPLKTATIQTNHKPQTTMTQDLAFSLLNRAANGAQILEILESIAADAAAEQDA